jgi:hypothetical protein
MGLKLPLPLPDPAALHRTGAKLRAWWNGEPLPDLFEHTADEAGAEQAITDGAVLGDDDIQAVLWGPGRLWPLDATFDGALAKGTGADKGTSLALMGGGGAASACAVVEALGCKVEMFEADAERVARYTAHFKAAEKPGKRCHAAVFDWTPGSLPKNKCGALVMAFAVENQDRADAAAFIAERVLKPGGTGIIIDFVARRDDAVLDACRGPSGRAFVEEESISGAIAAAGLTLRGDDDWGPDYLDGFTRSWTQLKAGLEQSQARLMKSGGQDAAQRALESLILWKARAQAIRGGRLSVRRYKFDLS